MRWRQEQESVRPLYQDNGHLLESLRLPRTQEALTVVQFAGSDASERRCRVLSVVAPMKEVLFVGCFHAHCQVSAAGMLCFSFSVSHDSLSRTRVHVAPGKKFVTTVPLLQYVVQ
jgi:hypothetical protein